MSTCDRCFSPGQCCRDLILSTQEGVITSWDDTDPRERVTEAIGEHWFEPILVNGTWTTPDDDPVHPGRSYSAYQWRCRALGPDGRCTVYERRPQLCRDFEAGSDPLCVHWRGAESDERSVV